MPDEMRMNRNNQLDLSKIGRSQLDVTNNQQNRSDINMIDLEELDYEIIENDPSNPTPSQSRLQSYGNRNEELKYQSDIRSGLK